MSYLAPYPCQYCNHDLVEAHETTLSHDDSANVVVTYACILCECTYRVEAPGRTSIRHPAEGELGQAFGIEPASTLNVPGTATLALGAGVGELQGAIRRKLGMDNDPFAEWRKAGPTTTTHGNLDAHTPDDPEH